MQWVGFSPTHEEYLNDYWDQAHDSEYHGKCGDGVHDHGSHSVPPDEELWMRRPVINVFGD